MIRIFPGLWIAVVTAGCLDVDLDEVADTSEQAIIGGIADSGDPAVAALIVRAGANAGQPHCTATLIAPNRLLTAAHCINDSNTYEVHFGDRFDSGRAHLVSGIRRHPSASHDLAIVTLARGVVIPPVPIGRAALSPSAVGQTVRIVGFGRNGQPSGIGVKRFASTTISAVNDRFIRVGSGSGPQKCNGDSGGPTLMVENGIEVIVGVSSFGSGCQGGSWDSRVDIDLDFIDQHL